MISVIGGAGHVGLPMVLALADEGLECQIIDRDTGRLNEVRTGRVPFLEPGAHSKLSQALDKSLLKFSAELKDIQGSDTVIVVVGTPVDEYGQSKPRSFLRLIEDIEQFLDKTKLIVLRSTLAIGTSRQITRRLKSNLPSIHVAYCPERIAQHQAFDEIRNLPQIVSGDSAESVELAKSLFLKTTDEIVCMEFEEAEFGKLMANAWRYAKFAIANDFAKAAMALGLDYELIRTKVSFKYPRAADLPRPGFAAGPCLPKDTQQFISSTDTHLPTLSASIQSNELLPKFVRQKIQESASSSMTVGILGMAFKPRSDDIRESLAYRLKHELSMHFKRVIATDPYVSFATDPVLESLDYVLKEADILVVGCPHPEYQDLQTKVPLLDIWGMKGWIPSQI